LALSTRIGRDARAQILRELIYENLRDAGDYTLCPTVLGDGTGKIDIRLDVDASSGTLRSQVKHYLG
jgi:hypothetical protein